MPSRYLNLDANGYKFIIGGKTVYIIYDIPPDELKEIVSINTHFGNAAVDVFISSFYEKNITEVIGHGAVIYLGVNDLTRLLAGAISGGRI